MIKQFELGKDSRALINELSKSKEITDEYICCDVEYRTGSRLEYDVSFLFCNKNNHYRFAGKTWKMRICKACDS